MGAAMSVPDDNSETSVKTIPVHTHTRKKKDAFYIMRDAKRATRKKADALFANEADFDTSVYSVEKRKLEWIKKKITYHDLEYTIECAKIDGSGAKVEQDQGKLEEVNVAIL